MKIRVKQSSLIERYEEAYGSFSAFMLRAAPLPADSERVEEEGTGELLSLSPFSISYRTAEGRPVSLCLDGARLTIKRGFSEMVFEKGANTAFSYRTEYGTLEIKAFTDGITLKEKEGTFLLRLVYYALLGDMMQKNTLRFLIAKEER